MNKRKEKQRVANGKPAKLVDSSMAKVYQAGPSEKTENGYRLGDQAFDDLTDVQNDEVGPVGSGRFGSARRKADGMQFVYSY